MAIKTNVTTRIWKIKLKNKYTGEKKEMRIAAESEERAKLLVRDEWEIMGKIEAV